MKRVLVTTFAVAALFGLASVSANAAPGASAIGLATTSGTRIIFVAAGCGVGWHRGPYGGCRRNFGWRWPCHWVRGRYGRLHLVCRRR